MRQQGSYVRHAECTVSQPGPLTALLLPCCCLAAAAITLGVVSCSPYIRAMEAAGFFKPQDLPAMLEQSMALVE